jgi:hypothetical protein
MNGYVVHHAIQGKALAAIPLTKAVENHAARDKSEL